MAPREQKVRRDRKDQQVPKAQKDLLDRQDQKVRRESRVYRESWGSIRVPIRSQFQGAQNKK